MKILFHGKVPKDSEAFNEDAYSLSSELVAVSDGATNSYNSKAWAKLIVNRFIRNPKVNTEWVNSIIDKFNSLNNNANMSWSQLAAFEKGSFASLLGVEHHFEDKTVNVLAIGDSFAILLDGTKFIDSFPYSSSEEFNQRPELLSTISDHNKFIDSDTFHSTHSKSWSISNYSRPLLLCMTDALGQWAMSKLEDNSPEWEQLCNIESLEQLQKLVTQERLSKKMKLDDVTFVLIDLIQNVPIHIEEPEVAINNPEPVISVTIPDEKPVSIQVAPAGIWTRKEKNNWKKITLTYLNIKTFQSFTNDNKKLLFIVVLLAVVYCFLEFILQSHMNIPYSLIKTMGW